MPDREKEIGTWALDITKEILWAMAPAMRGNPEAIARFNAVLRNRTFNILLTRLQAVYNQASLDEQRRLRRTANPHLVERIAQDVAEEAVTSLRFPRGHGLAKVVADSIRDHVEVGLRRYDDLRPCVNVQPKPSRN